MKAWLIEKHGGPEVMKQVDMPAPTPGPMEVLIRVEAVGLNHLDLWVRKGVPGHSFPLPLIPGCDIAGTIAEFGPGSEKVLSQSGQNKMVKGTPIVVSAGVSCGRCEACLGGFDPLCRHYGIFGETQNGGCCELICVPVENVVARPSSLSAVDAASLPIAYLTAWTMLVRKAHVAPGDVVLIQSGGSGVSIAAIQIAKLYGATVLTTVGNPSKVEKAKSLGADFVIEYQKNPFRDEVKKILKGLGKKGCDIVIDHVGTDTFAESLKCLNWGGKLVTCGATSGADISLDLKAIFFKNISILGSTMGSKSDFLKAVELVASGKLKTQIDRVFPMAELPKAYEYLESRTGFGKVVLSY